MPWSSCLSYPASLKSSVCRLTVIKRTGTTPLLLSNHLRFCRVKWWWYSFVPSRLTLLHFTCPSKGYSRDISVLKILFSSLYSFTFRKVGINFFFFYCFLVKYLFCMNVISFYSLWQWVWLFFIFILLYLVTFKSLSSFNS